MVVEVGEEELDEIAVIGALLGNELLNVGSRR
jgi:hypothetical protein